MAYIVLARKYRSKNFSELVGQEHVVRALSNALATQRLHHAYLFTGTRGVGKTTVSRILAKSLNCQGPDGTGGITPTPCGVCMPCQDIDSGRFVDYTELDAASNRGVDEVQALLEQAVYKPVQGRFKVFMIDEVHMLTNTAFNAMLKTLEEPPEYLKFVLATTDPQKVPVTVLSRCLQFNLRPMAPETVRAHLAHVLQAEGIESDVQALRLLARSARGSMRDALSLTDQAIAFGSGRLDEDTVRQMLGSVDRSHVFRLIDALARCDGRSVVETSETLRLHGLSAASTLDEMSTVLQRMAVLQAVAGSEAVAFAGSLAGPVSGAPGGDDDSDPEAAEISRLAERMPPDETQLLYSMCLHGRAELGLAPDDYAALTMVLLRLLAFKPRQPAQAAASAQAPTAAPQAEKKTLSESHFSEQNRPAEPMDVRHTAIENVANRVKSEATPPASATAAAAPAAQPNTSPTAPTAPTPTPRGQVLAVREIETHGHSKPAVPPTDVQDATALVAVPVRTQSPASPRTEPLNGTSAANTLVLTEEGAFWHGCVQQLIAQEAISALVRELALQSQLVARDVDQWLLRVERESLNQPVSRERLQTALKALGHDVLLAVEVGRVQDSPAKRNAKAAAERMLAAEKIIFDDPYVQSLMRDFGAKIVPGSIKPLA